MDAQSNATRSLVLRWLGVATLIAVSGCSPPQPPFVPSAAQPCPPWLDTPAARDSNAQSPYWQCHNAVNLRNMVERPDDLENGRPMGPASGEREAIGVKAYGEGKIKPPGGGAAGGATAPAMPTVSISGEQ
jgi:hypothetical protein